MDSMISDALPLTELFGTFFEKVTHGHQYKDALRNELAEFKCVIYTNLYNTQRIDSYLDTLKTKNPIPEQISYLQEVESPRKAQINGRFASQENSPTAKSPLCKNQKAEVVTLSDFIKYRTIGQADKQQILQNRYSHVQVLGKDPMNLYRMLAMSYFTSILQSPGSVNKLSDIVDEIAAQRIPLSCPKENLTHEDLCGIFCGFFSQLTRMKQVRASFKNIMQTFLEMVDEDKVFSISLSCFIKSKIYSFVQRNDLPSELTPQKAYLQSESFKEKVECNDIGQSDLILKMMPFVLEKQIVAQIFENGKISEVIYKPSSSSEQKSQELGKHEIEEVNSIHLLIEKAFMSFSIFGLFTHASLPLSAGSMSPTKQQSAEAIRKESPPKQFGQAVADFSPNTKRNTPKVRTLTIDTLVKNSLKANYQARMTSNNPNEVTDRSVAQEKGNLEGLKCNELISKLQPRENLMLNFGSLPINNKDGENQNRLIPAAGDTAIVSEITYREANEKNEGVGVPKNIINKEIVSASIERMKYNSHSYRDPSVMTGQPLSANTRLTITTTGSQNKNTSKTIYNPSDTKTANQSRSHQRTNSYGSYVSIYANQKEPSKTEPPATTINTSTGSIKQENSTVAKTYHHQRTYSYQQKTQSNDKPSHLTLTTQYSLKNNETTRYQPETRNLAKKNAETAAKIDYKRAEASRIQENSQNNCTLDDLIKETGANSAYPANNHSKEKLKTLIANTSKGQFHIPTGSISVGNSPTKHHRTLSNFEFSSNNYQDMSPTLQTKPVEFKLYQPSSNYATQRASYQPTYTPKSDISRNDSMSRDLSSSPTATSNRNSTSTQNNGYSSSTSPRRYTGDMTQKNVTNANTSQSFGIQLTPLSTNTSFNNFGQAYAKQASLQTQTPV